MILPLIIGVVGIVITVALHGVVTTLIAKLILRYGPIWRDRFGDYARSLILVMAAVVLAIKHFVDITLWAIAYRFFHAEEFDHFEEAIYFSSVTYTTLGYGDIVLTGNWRLMCGMQAMNGILLFGWSSAMLFLFVQSIWKDRNDSDSLAKP